MGARPTKNPDAYDAYLRGLAFAGGVEDFRTSLLKSIEAFENAVRLDPEFAVAWAHLSRQNGFAFINNVGQAPERREAARKALDMAIKFGPELVETQLAKAFYKYYCERDYEGAKAQLESIRRQYPNNAVVWEFLGGIARRQGQWEQSRALYAQAVELDPQNIFLLTDAALTDLAMRDAVAAQKHLGRARDLSPQNSTLISFLAQSFQLGGDIAQAQALLDTVQPKRGDSVYVSTAVTNAILLRKYDSALAMLKAQLEQPDALGSDLGVFENALGDLERHAGNTAEATMAYQKAKQAVNDLLRAEPENSEFLLQLAWADTWLGDKAAAFAHAKQAIAALPASKDAFVGPGYEDILARIEAHFGEKDSAIGALQHLLSVSYGSPVTRALLRIDPDWDPSPRRSALREALPEQRAVNFGNLFAELKRRNVIRMAGLYLVGAWLVVQVAGTVLPMFGAPEWLPRTIVVLLAIGFVPAVIFSWVFELTPAGPEARGGCGA